MVGSITMARSYEDMYWATQEASREFMHVADILDIGFVDELVESRMERSLEIKRIAELLVAEGELKSYVSKRLHLSSYEISQRLELFICSLIAPQLQENWLGRNSASWGVSLSTIQSILTVILNGFSHSRSPKIDLHRKQAEDQRNLDTRQSIWYQSTALDSRMSLAD
jgi:hypothetical protein